MARNPSAVGMAYTRIKCLDGIIMAGYAFAFNNLVYFAFLRPRLHVSTVAKNFIVPEDSPLTLEVLQGKTQIREARHELAKKGVSIAQADWQNRLSKLFGSQSLAVGDRLKSWDVLKTFSFLEDQLSKDDMIFDQGSYCCEMLPMLHRAGYRRLSGADLNPDVIKMSYSDVVDYRVENFLAP